jgi:hypothetical protein
MGISSLTPGSTSNDTSTLGSTSGC